MRIRRLSAFILANIVPVLLVSAASAADGAPLLTGRVVSTTGAALAGIPVRAQQNGSGIAVSVYSDAQGDYSFPDWSAITPGAYAISVDLPDFERVAKSATITAGVAAKVDLTLAAKALSIADATGSEIIAALPGTDQQKTLFSQCDNCHSLQWALVTGRTREEWIAVIRQMAGRAADLHQPGTYAFSQKQFIEPLADYLVSIRGPDSSDTIPFRQRPRPTTAEATNIVVTEYAVPRGGKREPYMLRGDRRFVWPHDVIVNDKYAYYTDHFSYVLGRVDIRTGEATELPFSLPKGAGRGNRPDDGRPGDPGGGAQELEFDGSGNVIIGMDNGTVKYDPKTGEFVGWATGSSLFGLDPQGNVWSMRRNGELEKIDTTVAGSKPTTYLVPKNAGIYDTDTDSKGRTDLYIWRDARIGLFDPSNVSYAEFLTPTPMSGPRRGMIDEKDRLWAAEFYAGQILRFDPDKRELREYSLIPGVKAFSAPFPMAYAVSADLKNHIAWTNDFNSSRIYRIDIETGKSTEIMTPSNYEVRDFFTPRSAPRPTVWLPAYRPPAKIVKIEVR